MLPSNDKNADAYYYNYYFFNNNENTLSTVDHSQSLYA